MLSNKVGESTSTEEIFAVVIAPKMDMSLCSCVENRQNNCRNSTLQLLYPKDGWVQFFFRECDTSFDSLRGLTILIGKDRGPRYGWNQVGDAQRFIVPQKRDIRALPRFRKCLSIHGRGASDFEMIVTLLYFDFVIKLLPLMQHSSHAEKFSS